MDNEYMVGKNFAASCGVTWIMVEQILKIESESECINFIDVLLANSIHWYLQYCDVNSFKLYLQLFIKFLQKL